MGNDFHAWNTLESVLANGGGTFSPVTKKLETFDHGYQVSIDDVLKINPKALSVFLFADIVNSLSRTIIENELWDHYIGFWIDPETKELCVDLSIHETNRETAEQMAREFWQKAIWDWNEQKSIYVF